MYYKSKKNKFVLVFFSKVRYNINEKCMEDIGNNTVLVLFSSYKKIRK